MHTGVDAVTSDIQSARFALQSTPLLDNTSGLKTHASIWVWVSNFVKHLNACTETFLQCKIRLLQDLMIKFIDYATL